MPAISVIVPVYKVEPYLRRCVDSILAQTFTDFELILVDDGSPDNCGAICDEYAAKDARIHVIHKENGGLSSARNAGIDWAFANSDSEWIAFVDSDDWVHPKYLSYLYRAVREDGTKVSVCGYREVADHDGQDEAESYCSEILPWEDLFLKQNLKAIIAWNKLYAKELLSELRYPVGKLFEDEFLTYKLISQYPSLSQVDCDLYYYFYNSEGISKQPFNLKRMDVVEAFDERLEYFRNSENRSVMLFCLKSSLWSIYDTWKKIREAETLSEKDRMYYEKRLQKTIQRTLFRNFPMTLTKGCAWYNLMVFPRLYSFLYNVYRMIKGRKDV